MKNILIVTGGCGFVGSNLIEYLIKNTSYKIISLDDYSSGSKKIVQKVKELNILKVTPKILLKFYTQKKKQ